MRVNDGGAIALDLADGPSGDRAGKMAEITASAGGKAPAEKSHRGERRFDQGSAAWQGDLMNIESEVGPTVSTAADGKNAGVVSEAFVRENLETPARGRHD